MRRYFEKKGKMTHALVLALVLAVCPKCGRDHLPDPPKAERGQSNEALVELNQRRATHGLFPLREDAKLTRIAQWKADLQAKRDRGCFHPGGTFGGARAEGVGSGNRFLTCYMWTRSHRIAGAAVSVSKSGRKYYCLLVR